MNVRIALLGIVGTAMLSTAALAATGSNTENHPANREQMADRCATLESQYEGVLSSHPDTASLARAESLASSGTSECQSDQGTMGTQKLEQALSDLGVKPVD